MVDPEEFVADLDDAGFGFFSGVPCSLFGAALERIARGGRYVPASVEGEALAMASGAWLAGVRSAVFSQNSGLGNLVNPITSLSDPFRIPVLLLISWRGAPGTADAPQHRTMGKVTPELLRLLDIPYRELPASAGRAGEILGELAEAMEHSSRPVALLVHKGAFPPCSRSRPPQPASRRNAAIATRLESRTGAPASRTAALDAIVRAAPPTAGLIATTGKTGRELFSLRPAGRNLYVVGAMGSASAIGLGVALHTDRPIVVIDGDGAALMRLGTMATIGAAAPKNLLHIVLDNGTYDSTGGQPSVAGNVDFAAVAAACGYAGACDVDDLAGLSSAMAEALRKPGPRFVRMKISPGSPEQLERPAESPSVFARRFADFIQSPLVFDSNLNESVVAAEVP